MSTVVVYAPGVYDLFHIGHLNVLKHARAHCDHLIAGVVSDEMCELAKGTLALACRKWWRELRAADAAVAR